MTIFHSLAAFVLTLHGQLSSFCHTHGVLANLDISPLTAAINPQAVLQNLTSSLFDPSHLDGSPLYRACVCLQPAGVGTAQLSKSIFNFTDTQDVRVLVGCNAVINHKGDIVKVLTR